MEGIRTFSRAWDEKMEERARDWFMACYATAGMYVTPRSYLCRNDKRQLAGVDLMVGTDKIDEKCGLHYAICGADNFCFELEATNGIPGWFVSPHIETTHYSLMIPRAATIDDLENGRLTGLTWTLVDKKKLTDWCVENLGIHPSQMRRMATKKRVVKLSNGCTIVRSQLPEKPLVLLIPIDTVLSISDKYVRTKNF